AVAPATVAVRRPPRRRRGRRIALLVGLVPLIALVVLAVLILQPFAGDGDEPVTVRIPAGSSVGDVGKALEEQGVIGNATFFSIRARLSGGGATIQAGNLKLRKNMSYAAALDALQDAPAPAPVVRVSVPEGLSRREAAAAVKDAGVSGDYVRASAHSAGFDPHRYGQPKRQTGLEGFLFPATYELPRKGATSTALVAKQVAAFRDAIGEVDTTRARRAGLNRYEVLIVASMIEREVRIPSERRLVAAVIYNRLKQGMPLGIDATTRYAERNWTRPLKVSELERDGPYNTRTRKGLPPTPIGNPGLASIRAAAKPASASYLYYVVKPCGGGRHAFSSTDAEFAKDAAAYNQAQRRAGGDPSDPDSKACKR
ncbi:endolytic transglycosylase MltG, partial [Patulibacter sp. S7RM1-6]